VDEEAIEKGYRVFCEEFRILKLARDGYITGLVVPRTAVLGR